MRVFSALLVCIPWLSGCSVEIVETPQNPPNSPAESDGAEVEAQGGVEASVELSVGGDANGSAVVNGCQGNEEKIIDGAKIDASGVAVEAHGNCKLTVRNSTIAGDVGIEAHGNAKVFVEACTVTGRRHAMELHGNAMVTVKSSTFNGAIEAHGSASMADEGGNTFDISP